jgi:hypothetical protein
VNFTFTFTFGHAVRMDQGRTVEKIFNGKPEGSVKRRLEMQVKRWRQKAVDKEERASVCV